MPQDNALMGQITAQLEGDWTTIITRKAGEVPQNIAKYYKDLANPKYSEI